ncbi:MAG: DUF4364 family protein [Clostridia bacterium]|nr:DUF4364 family protein [Clostridia bacterium]
MKLKESADIKLYILTLMLYVDYPLRYSQINDIVVQDEFVSNFDFIDQFEELKEAQFVRCCGDDMYEITETGAFIARTLKGDISGYIREKGIRHAIQLLSFEKSKTKIKTELTPGEGDTVDLNLQIFRRGQRVISVTVNAETDFQAKRMEHSFTENPEHLYKFIYSFLMGEGGY